MDQQAAAFTVPTGAETYSSAMADAKNYMAWLLDAFGSHLTAPVLEIGVGHGSYAEILRRHGTYMGVDIDPQSVMEARRRFPDLAFAAADITSPSFLEVLGDRRFRSIICLNVLEHIPEHETAVMNLAGALETGGHLLVIVPALPMLYNDLDRLAGHLRRYRRQQVQDLFDMAKLETVKIDYFNPIGGLGWWANRLKRHRSLNAADVNAQITLFDRWLVPLSRFVDPATCKIFGQSVIAIGRRP